MAIMVTVVLNGSNSVSKLCSSSHGDSEEIGRHNSINLYRMAAKAASLFFIMVSNLLWRVCLSPAYISHYMKYDVLPGTHLHKPSRPGAAVYAKCGGRASAG